MLNLPDSTLGYSLNYNSWGHSDAPRTLFCVHGLTRMGKDFEKLSLYAVRYGFRVIAPDMPGRGASPRMSDPMMYNNVAYAGLCMQLIQGLGLREVYWVGTSMGGIVGMMLANQYPRLIRRMVLNDIGCSIPADALRRIAGYVGHNPEFKTFAEAEALLRERTINFGIPAVDWDYFAQYSIAQTIGGYQLRYDPNIAHTFNNMEELQDVNLWQLWQPMLTIPTLLIRGEHSDLLTENTAHEMAHSHPRLTRVNVPGVGHAPALMTEPEISHIINFIND